MNVSLTPELEALVQEKVKSGLYNSASEVVREALRLLKEQDTIKQMRLEELKREIAVGLEQVNQGEATAFSSAGDLMDAVRRAGTRRKRQRKPDSRG